MRILMTDSRNDRLLAHFYAKHLNEIAGVQVGSLFYTDEFDEYYRSVFNKAVYRILPNTILRKINQGIIRSIEEFRPDLIWIIKGMEIFPETLHYAKQRGIKLANYNPDHPFVFKSAGSGNQFVRDSIPIYDLHLSYSREILRELDTVYRISGKHLPFGFEISPDIIHSAEKEAEINRIAFTGVADEDRIRVIGGLLEAGFSVDVYGPGWKRALKPSARLQVFDGVYSDSFWNILRKYRLQINVFRKQNFNSHNMRSFEIPGIGGIMLAPSSEEHLEFFKKDQEAFFYSNESELIETAKSILAFTPAEADRVRINARERSVKSGYAYKERSQLVFDYFSTLLN